MGSNMYSLVISNDSTVYSFGYNAGQLGLGDTDERNVPTLIPSLSNVKQVSCGQIHSLALLNDGTVYAFGINNAGQLGLGDTDDRNVPTLIPSLSNVKQVSCGFAFSLALLNDGTVYAFGSNSYGELGLGNDCRTPTLIPSLSNVKQVSCAAEHSLVLLNDGTVYALGHNNYGQLGLGDNNDRNVPTLIPSLSNVKQVYCSYEHSLVLLENGTVYAFGYNSFGQLGLGDTNNRNVPTLIPSLSNVKQISCGYDFSLALLNDGTVYGFGDNYDGDLGLGNDTNGKCIPTLIPSLSNVKQISCGYEHSLALLNNGDVYTFGHNDNGQLGLGDTNDRDVPTLIPSLSNVKYLWDIIIPDTIIIDTDVYTESEKEFSMRDAIIKLIEWKRFNTEKKIDIHQKGLLPEFLNLTWNKDDLYFKNGVYQVSRYYKETCLHINGIRNNILFDESKNRYFCEKMADAYNKGIVQPFLLFVNKIHIPWSKITIVRSDFYISFLISDMNKKYQIDDVQILHIPFNITYTENIDEDATKQILFKFNANGLFNMDNSIFVYADNDNIKVNVYDDGSYTNFDMNISYKRKLTSANLVIFDSDGKLYRDAAILIKNANILTTNGNYVVCCYNTLSNANEANAVRALNEPFEKTLIIKYLNLTY
jgi:alpha-tubulin suppressor-like RCC1 family protein